MGRLGNVSRRRVNNRAPNLRDAVRVAAVAHESLHRARQELARTSKPGDPAVSYVGPWRDAHKALIAHRDHLMALPGVIGTAIGLRRRSGMRICERCVVAFVERKRSVRELRRRNLKRVPETVRGPRERAVPTDVLEIGRLLRTGVLRGGDSLGPAPTSSSTRSLATLGTFALDSLGNTLALTAMHLFDADPNALNQQLAVTVPSQLEDPSAPVIGRLLDGTEHGIDAASIIVADPDVVSWTVGGMPIRGWRPLVLPSDEALSVSLDGAMSGPRTGVLAHFSCSFPPYDLSDAITAYIHTAPGDSGAALLDDQGHILALLVGQPEKNDPLRVFCAISPILDRLGCDIPSHT